MIRNVRPEDAEAIAAIYNEYVIGTTISFETEPLTVAAMAARIDRLAADFPYFVYETEAGVVGYCYAHLWKERAAYRSTLETTIYLAAGHTGRGIGGQLMRRLIDECRRRGYHALLACITADNNSSIALHEKLGFRRVSEYHEVGRKFGRWLGVEDYELLL